jgi:uncharacterized membrane protein YgcG
MRSWRFVTLAVGLYKKVLAFELPWRVFRPAMKSPSCPLPSRKFLAAFAAVALATPVIFAAGGRGGGGGGGAGGTGGAGNRGGSAPKAPSPITELLKKYDKNSNQKLDTDELKTIKKEDAALFDTLIKFDANKNNVLETAELEKWGETKKPAANGNQQGGGRGGATGGGGQQGGGGGRGGP